MNEIIRNLPALAPQYNEQPINLPTTLREALDRAADFAANEKAASTRQSYQSSFRIFSDWCGRHGLSALPATPAAVAAFIGDQATAGLKVATLGRRISAIKYFHRKAGEASPTDDERVKSVLRGARRTLGVAPRKLAAATAEKIILMQGRTSRSLAGKRDKAILLLGFALAARRSELVSLDVDDITECDEGLRVRIKRSKTDQEGAGVTIAVCRGRFACPVVALKDWMTAAGITSGPIFRRVLRGDHVTGDRLTAQTICKLVKAYVAKAGLDPSQYGAHSLRAGAVTTAAARGASVFKIKDLSRHASLDVLASYVRDGNLFQDHCLSGVL
jgi:site-specific recombinase XerD